MTKDRLYHISLLDGQARAFFIEGTELVQKAKDTHGLSRIASAALGRTLCAASMMGAMLKGEQDSVTVQLKGGGPLGTVLAVAKSDTTVKGYVDDPSVDLPRTGKKLPVGAAVGRNGRLTVIKDMHMREPYTGQVNLVSGEIAEDFALYFSASEQTPSLVALGVLVSDERIESAGGVILQMMPGADESAVRAVEESANRFENISETLRELHLDGAVERILGHLQPVILEERTPRYLCDCSRQRVEKALIALGREELSDMIEAQHGAEVSCHFCDRVYHFTEQDLRSLLASAVGKAGS